MHLVKQSCYFNFFADMEIKFFDNICGCSSGSTKIGRDIKSEFNFEKKRNKTKIEHHLYIEDSPGKFFFTLLIML